MCFRALWLVVYPPASPSRVPDQHTWHEWMLVTEGVYRVRVEGKRTELLPGESILIPKGCLHQPMPENQSRILVMQWEGDAYVPDAPQRLHDVDGRHQDIMTWMWRTWMRQEEGVQEFMDAQLLALLLTLRPHIREESSWIEDVELYLRNYTSKNLDLNQLERAFGRSPRQITRAFKERYHSSPIAYHRKFRSEQAA